MAKRKKRVRSLATAVSNATAVIPAGTYTFIETPTITIDALVNVSGTMTPLTADNVYGAARELTSIELDPTSGSEMLYINTVNSAWNQYDNSDSTWAFYDDTDESYYTATDTTQLRTITLTSAVNVTEAFCTWFTSNTTKQSSYKFKHYYDSRVIGSGNYRFRLYHQPFKLSLTPTLDSSSTGTLKSAEPNPLVFENSFASKNLVISTSFANAIYLPDISDNYTLGTPTVVTNGDTKTLTVAVTPTTRAVGDIAENFPIKLTAAAFAMTVTWEKNSSSVGDIISVTPTALYFTEKTKQTFAVSIADGYSVQARETDNFTVSYESTTVADNVKTIVFGVTPTDSATGVIMDVMSIRVIQDTPQLSTPQNVTIDGTTLSWDEVENATSYDIYADGTVIGNTTGGQ